MTLITTVALAVAACANGDSPSGQPGAGGNAVAVEVIDGDTVVVRVGDHTERVRLIGVDTPETRDPRRPAECFGSEASEFVRELLPPGTAVVLSIDAEPRDAYGRLLAYLARADDGLFVNLALLENGFAEPLSIEPNTIHAATFRAATARARAAGSGLWSACDPA